ncbi:MAG: hypothetical protein ACI837_003126 [Crocinitomicaceae bacterium]|jgi:hypothetical protein
MRLRHLKITFLTFVCVWLFISESNAQDTHDDKHIEVSLRMIGHQVLLNANDSTSRVLPILREKDQYRVQFESDFGFNPDQLVTTINQVFDDTKMINGYFLEVVQCETGKVIYSFEMGKIEGTDVISCSLRDQPKSCYSLLFTLVGRNSALNTSIPAITKDSNFQTNRFYIIGGIVLLILISLVFFLGRKRRNNSTIDPNLISLGKYHFDKRKSILRYEEQRIELTSKEADLLLLLYHAINTTVEREVILNLVWGDEGDYVGRTLDVFISKLRKKLEADTTLQIVNIRGVGYKLVAD